MLIHTVSSPYIWNPYIWISVLFLNFGKEKFCVCDYAIKVKIWPYGRIPRSDLRKLNKILFFICKKHISV